ncbi:MAG: hypothetical protein QM737_07865 [Ferruginibacter sp.]
MKNKITLFTLAVVLCLFACKKNNDVSAPVVPVTKDTPVLLTRLLLLDTSQSNPDTIATYDFSYDDSYRPIRFVYHEMSNYKSEMTYEYQGTDTLANRTTTIETSISGSTTTIQHDTNYYFYQGDKLMSDSFISEDGNHYQVRHYNYLADRITADYASVTINPVYSYNGTMVFYETMNNGNLMNMNDTIIYNYPTLTQYLVNNVAVTYLDHPDPYYKVIRPIRRVYYDEADWIWYPIPLFVSPQLPAVTQHDIDSWNSTGGSAGVNTCVYQYDFRPDGYPSVMHQVDHESGIYDAYFKLVYFYNK